VKFVPDANVAIDPATHVCAAPAAPVESAFQLNVVALHVPTAVVPVFAVAPFKSQYNGGAVCPRADPIHPTIGVTAAANTHRPIFRFIPT
jgi:hypothetical protein